MSATAPSAGTPTLGQIALTVHDVGGSVAFYRDRVGLPFRVPDIESAHREMSARGVPFVDAPHLIASMPDHELWMSFFRDPDGHTLALMCERPSAAT
ncbi:MAG: hypothetical protein LH467_14765 [Gemmatimonadaceae bacterium]|nr:hypothetical protein [Gemmatimonadaceae bacterium]